MPNSQPITKIVGGAFIVLSIFSLLFSFSMWFLVPPDPAGNLHGVDSSKARLALVGVLVAAVMFLLSKYFFRKAAHDRSGE